MDVSDGLAGDLVKMLGDGRGARIEAAAIPLSAAAAAALAAEPGLIQPILTGGDDYEILCAVPPEALDGLRADAAAGGVQLTLNGTMTSSDGPPVLQMGDGAARGFSAGAFSPF